MFESHGLARGFSVFWRFAGLRLAKRVFRGTQGPLPAERGFAGYRLALDLAHDVYSQLLYLEGVRLIGERFLLGSMLQPGMRVVDVGANIGYMLLLFECAVGAAGEVLCIEPSPENLPTLRRNIECNGLRNVRLVEAAVGSSRGQVGFRAGINGGVTGGSDSAYQVPMVTLDTLVPDRVDFLKIDVDGYEGQALLGATEVLRRDRPVVFLEFHPLLVTRFGHSFESVMALLLPHYANVTFWEQPEPMTLGKKIAVRYFAADPLRQFDAMRVPPERLHEGREFGTFWIVCRPMSGRSDPGICPLTRA